MNRLAALGALLFALPAFADWWNVPGGGGNVPDPGEPVCVANCGDDSSSSSGSSNQGSQERYVDPEEEARRQAAAAAAAEAARVEAERLAREALQDYEHAHDAARRLGEKGASVREQARRFADFSEQVERREERAGSLEGLLAPVSAPKVLAGPAPGALPSTLSMKEYCQRLNAAAPPKKGLHVSDVPLPSAGAGTRTAAFKEAPKVPSDRFAEALTYAGRARAALKEELRETAEAVGWRYLDGHVPFLKSAREVFESGKQTYEALSKLHTGLATQAFTHAGEVALTVGGGGGTATPDDNDRLLRSMGQDVNRTSSTLLADQARSSLKESVLDKWVGWFGAEEGP
ncbi:MAG: hypothetical protein ACYC8T_11440 [Myxococcaceae bacterium]